MEHNDFSGFSVVKMAHVFGVSRSGFRKYKNRPKTHYKYRTELKVIRDVFKNSYQTYGSPLVWPELKKLGYKISENTVAKIMRENNICVKPRRKFVHKSDKSKGYRVAPNILQQNFTASGPNEKWVSGEWKYLAVIIDLYSRKVVGWAFDHHMRSDLIIEALLMAVSIRSPKAGLIIHSDRGVQYASKEYRSHLRRFGMVQSMSRRAKCWDNAVAESFFKSLKYEFLLKWKLQSMHETKMAIFEYIEAFYNTQRSHSTLNYKSPSEFELSEVYS